MTFRKLALLPRIIIAMAAGIAAGSISPLWFAQLCETFNMIFGQLLGFLVPLIIIGFVIPAIAEIGHKAGKMLLFTALLAYAATITAGLGAFTVSDAVFPGMIDAAAAHDLETEAAAAIEPWFSMTIPPALSIMTALALAFMTGLGLAYCKAPTLTSMVAEFRTIMTKTINGCVIPLLPVYIFCIFNNMTVGGQVASVLSTFARIIAVIFVMHVALLLMQYCIAALFGRRNPLKMLRTMMPAYFTALGTQSSAATIPVTLRQTVKMGVSEEVAGFTVPLCATIHMSGSTMKIVSCALALMLMQQIPYDFGQFTQFIALLGITIIAAPGIPGGAIMASLGLLSSVLGFSDAQNAMMIALYIAMDSFGTACNVTGDGALAVIVDFFFGRRRDSKPTDSPTSPDIQTSTNNLNLLANEPD